MPRFLPRLARIPRVRLGRISRQVVRNGKHGSPSRSTELGIRPSPSYLCAAETTRIYLLVMGIEKRLIFEKPHWRILGEKVDAEYRGTSQ
jgi:hypothetical protein